MRRVPWPVLRDPRRKHQPDPSSSRPRKGAAPISPCVAIEMVVAVVPRWPALFSWPLFNFANGHFRCRKHHRYHCGALLMGAASRERRTAGLSHVRDFNQVKPNRERRRPLVSEAEDKLQWNSSIQHSRDTDRGTNSTPTKKRRVQLAVVANQTSNQIATQRSRDQLEPADGALFQLNLPATHSLTHSLAHKHIQTLQASSRSGLTINLAARDRSREAELEAERAQESASCLALGQGAGH